MGTRWSSSVFAGAVVFGLAMSIAADDKGEKGKMETRVFELRTYHVHPGKMSALHARFREHSNRLLEKHGMKLIGFWTPTDAKDGDETLIYVVAHADRETADKNWQAFQADPDWKEAKAASEKDGPLVKSVDRVFMKPTNYSALK